MSNPTRENRLHEGLLTPAQVTLMAATAVTATAQDTSAVSNTSYLGVLMFVNVSALALNEAITVRFQGYDAAALTYTTMYTPATITAAGGSVYHVGIGSAQTAAAIPVPGTWRLEFLKNTTTATTITASYQYVPYPAAP